MENKEGSRGKCHHFYRKKQLDVFRFPQDMFTASTATLVVPSAVVSTNSPDTIRFPHPTSEPFCIKFLNRFLPFIGKLPGRCCDNFSHFPSSTIYICLFEVSAIGTRKFKKLRLFKAKFI